LFIISPQASRHRTHCTISAALAAVKWRYQETQTFSSARWQKQAMLQARISGSSVKGGKARQRSALQRARQRASSGSSAALWR
jgi:hypothetical protein